MTISVEEIEATVTCIPFAVKVPELETNDIINNNIKQQQPQVAQKQLLLQQPSSSSSLRIMSVSNEPSTSNMMINDSYGIVGTIVLLGPKSALIWLGWGLLQQEQQQQQQQVERNMDDSTTIANDSVTSFATVGRSSNCHMGPLLISMPQHKPSLSSSSSSVCSSSSSIRHRYGTTSKLIGDTNTHNEILIQQMSSRLSEKLDMSILMSCSFDNMMNLGQQQHGTIGVNDSYEMITSRAAAFAEKEIFRILNEKRQQQQQQQQVPVSR